LEKDKTTGSDHPPNHQRPSGPGPSCLEKDKTAGSDQPPCGPRPSCLEKDKLASSKQPFSEQECDQFWGENDGAENEVNDGRPLKAKSGGLMQKNLVQTGGEQFPFILYLNYERLGI